jgi:His-Xaa-Ser system protein HxsD
MLGRLLTRTVADPAPAGSGGDARSLAIDVPLYGRAAVFRACYTFTDRCYLLLRPGAGEEIVIEFRAKEADTDLDQVLGEFANELIDQRVRDDLAAQTKGIRDLIVRQAFAEADFRAG